jgi:N4-(beta-N-acetylglucosaminyl)-L-asparaginase
MSNRRNFIKTTAIASVALALNSFRGKSEEEEDNKVIFGKVNKPIVISTWNF